MKLRSNKGYVMTDVSIAIIVLLILVPTIMGMVYSLNVTRRTTETKTDAINIAVNAIEAAKGIDISELNDRAILDSIKNDIYYNSMTINEEIVNGKNKYTAVIKTDIASYKVLINVMDYNEQDNTAVQNVIKTVTVNVKYKTSGQEKEIELKTVIKKL